GVEVFAWTTRIGAVALNGVPGADASATRDASPFFSLDPEGDRAATEAVDRARLAGDTVGGAFAVRATGVPAGLGDYAQWDARLDGRLAQALASIPAVKAVAIGDGADAAATPGSAFHDALRPDGRGGVRRDTNRAGGLEGGVTNGAPIVVSATMKPIPTLRDPLPSIDLETGEAVDAGYERSDVCAVPAASVVGEAMTALVLLDALLEATGETPWSGFPEAVAAWRRKALRPGPGAG
ncbi:MAG TPA: chorismate synthase, partial [Planctomycetota bacterium]|nr:chorismate synthase [Planctomycetota bacterium]